MAPRRLLYLDASALTAYLWQAHGPVLEDSFPPSADGLVRFDDYLQSHTRSVFHLVADVAEEGYHFEAVPPVRGADRRAMLRRKSSQYFFGSPYGVALSLGRQTSGRRDEQIVFAGLTRPQILEPWLTRLTARECPLASLHTLPMLMPELARRLKLDTRARLLVMATRAGLRQCFIENGALRFARLTALSPETTAKLPEAFVEQSERLKQYLAAQRWLGREAVLPVTFLVPEGRLPEFEACRQATPGLAIELSDIGSAAHACGLRPPASNGSGAETLCLHGLPQRRVSMAQLASPAERRYMHLWRANTALHAVTAVVLLGSALAVGKLYVLGTDTGETARALQDDIDRDRRARQAIEARLPSLPARPDELRGIVTSVRSLRARDAGPQPLFAEIARALDQMPAIRLERLDWQLAPEPEALSGQSTVPVAPTAPSASRTPTPPGTPNPSNLFAVGLLHATLPADHAAEPRRGIEAVQALAAAFAENPALRVQIVQWPVDLQPNQFLRAPNLSASDAKIDPPRFQIRVAVKLTPS